MNAYRAKSMRYPWPFALHGFASLAALALGRILPMAHEPDARLTTWAIWSIGALVIVAGVVLSLWAVRTLLDRHTTVLPNRCSSHLVTCGPFRYTRNPIYLGYTLIMAGIGLITMNAWFFIIATGTVIFTTLFAVKAEERHLHSRFGFEFERYCRSTSRWI
ncbi:MULTISPECIES: isoprenylcysteine carboxylmethyltransferase family protein [unclassified Rhizobium]|uniref:methyltransferase family protein n=1 Tax=unclassified Rhizobium TaxID=2613769 RepID=UPI0006FE5F0E|nr:MULTISPECIES: isoprenylcysteine carboxylmethyltransferase family protein [unclassified Rhizobium]KQV42546.1 isoprenylcysteine carboxyl methyltransferase [Rhizobium sp. Root1212]KRD21424.1 isoprenylcysteine carboxyl methyltransferase [Rhizobium sp. Root268]